MGRSRQGGNSAKLRFISLHFHFWDDPAWKVLSPSSRLVYIAAKRYFNGVNNGKIFLSVRKTATDTGLSKSTVQRSYDELQKSGFIRKAEQGFLGADGRGIANKWILTEIGFNGDQATQDYKKLFAEKIKSRT